MILFPFYDINLDLENVCYKDASWDISLVWRMCLPQRKDTQFQLRCFSCLLWAVTVFPEASVRFSPLDSICSRLCNPPHLPPFVREVQLFFSGESRGVFNTQSPSLPWFYFSLLCILFLINPVLQNEIGVRTWEWPDLKISLFFLSFLLLMTLIHPGILEVAAAGCSNVFFVFFFFVFLFFCMSEIWRTLPVPLWSFTYCPKQYWVVFSKEYPSCCPRSNLWASERSCRFLNIAETFKAGVKVVLIPTTWQQRTADIFEVTFDSRWKGTRKSLGCSQK